MSAIYGPPAERNIRRGSECNTLLHSAYTRVGEFLDGEMLRDDVAWSNCGISRVCTSQCDVLIGLKLFPAVVETSSQVFKFFFIIFLNSFIGIKAQLCPKLTDQHPAARDWPSWERKRTIIAQSTLVDVIFPRDSLAVTGGCPESPDQKRFRFSLKRGRPAPLTHRNTSCPPWKCRLSVGMACEIRRSRVSNIVNSTRTLRCNWDLGSMVSGTSYAALKGEFKAGKSSGTQDFLVSYQNQH